MNCPSCYKTLPVRFALASGLRKKSCPACNSEIIPTGESMEKINKQSVILGFFGGIPLGVICCYLWLVNLRPVLAMSIFIIGACAVLAGSFYYSRARIKFRQF